VFIFQKVQLYNSRHKLVREYLNIIMMPIAVNVVIIIYTVYYYDVINLYLTYLTYYHRILYNSMI